MAETPEDLIAELQQKNIKHTPDEIIWIGRDAEGKVVWLETGDRDRGMTHILLEHGEDFIQRSIKKFQIIELIELAISAGIVIGKQGRDRLIFEIEFQGMRQFVSISIGNNGYIVGANPTERRLIRKFSQS